MIHIGISGAIGSGKSTLAKQLVEHFDGSIIPFAYGVKQLAALETVDNRLQQMTQLLISYGATYTAAYISASMIDGYMAKYPSTPGIKNRRLLQFIGTEAGRDTIHPDIWIQAAHTRIANGAYPIIVSDDLRFDNEASVVDIHIGIVPTQCYEARKAGLDTEYVFSDHASEHSLTVEPDILIPACWSDDDLISIIQLITIAL